MKQQLLVAGLQTFYEWDGEGEQILLLHGWGGNLDSFAPVFFALKQRFSVCSLAFWGMGSQVPPKSWGVEEYAEAVRLFCAQKGIGKTHIIAHSFGCRVALVLAAKNPGLVQKMVLCSAAGLRRFSLKRFLKQTVFKARKKLAASGWIPFSQAEKKGSEEYRALPEEMRKIFVKVVNQDLSGFAGQIKQPTLLVWGQEDHATPLWMGKKLKKLIPGSELVLYERSGHFVYLDCLAEFLALSQSFLEE